VPRCSGAPGTSLPASTAGGGRDDAAAAARGGTGPRAAELSEAFHIVLLLKDVQQLRTDLGVELGHPQVPAELAGRFPRLLGQGPPRELALRQHL